MQKAYFFPFSSNDREKSGKKAVKSTFKRGTSISSGLVPHPETKKTKDSSKNEGKVKSRTNGVKIMKTRRRNSVPPDKDDKISERKDGVSQMKKGLASKALLASEEIQSSLIKKNSISEIVQSNLLDKMMSSKDVMRRSHSLDELDILRQSFFTFYI